MNKMSEEERLVLTRQIMGLLDEWGVDGADVINLLALPTHTRTRHLERFRHDTPFPDDEKVFERIEHLIGIADALRTTYPRNVRMGALWLHRPNPRFANRSPLRAMVERGLSGLVAVRTHLDCSYAWDRSGSRA